MICPKCSYVRQDHDTATMPGVCPSCGIAYAKWLKAREEAERVLAAEVEFSEEPALPREEREPLWLRFYHYACFVPSDRHESAFWGHSLIYVCFVIWGWRFIINGVDWMFIGSSFLHGVNLPFHEYGHVMFSPFGTFWMLLGGSLFQIMLPLFPLVSFMVLQRDNFAASIMLWWSGQNFIDVSPYIADAPLRAIPLTAGSDDSHDWWNLLSMSGSLDMADTYANLCFFVGVMVILLSNLWGGHLLWIEFHGRTRPRGTMLDLE